MRVLIVGCGYVGKAVGAELVQQGHSVWGLRRSHANDAELRAAGIVPVAADITVPETLLSLNPGYDWVVHCASASGGGVPEYTEVYLQGTSHLLAWLSSAPPAKFVYTSSTSVYTQNDGSTVDETSQTVPESPTGQILVRAEDLLLRAASERGFPSVALRVAGIYGPGRTYWLNQVRSGEARIEGDGGRILNMIHRDDVAGAIIAAFGCGMPGRIYNVVDDEPVTQLALLRWLSKRLGKTLPSRDSGGQRRIGKRGVTNKGVSNQKLKSELGYRLRFPTFREGYEAILDQEGI